MLDLGLELSEKVLMFAEVVGQNDVDGAHAGVVISPKSQLDLFHNSIEQCQLQPEVDSQWHFLWLLLGVNFGPE